MSKGEREENREKEKREGRKERGGAASTGRERERLFLGWL
jgi:hypothetical protein